MRLAAGNHRLKQLRRLARRRSCRVEQQLYVIEGPTLVNDALDAGVALDAVYLEDRVDRDLRHRLDDAGADLYELDDGVLGRVADTVTPQPVLATAPWPSLAIEAPPPGLVVVLAGVSDPGNAGTILRSAEAGGAVAVHFCGEGVDPLGPKVVRASGGAVFRIRLGTGTLAESAQALQRSGHRSFGAVVEGGTPHLRAALAGDVALVVGHESRGLAETELALVDETVSIAMAGRVESLNVAMAATVLVFESLRQSANYPAKR